jgi:urate oxidase
MRELRALRQPIHKKQAHTLTHTYKHLNTLTHTYTHLHIWTHIHTYTHTHTHTHSALRGKPIHNRDMKNGHFELRCSFRGLG